MRLTRVALLGGVLAIAACSDNSAPTQPGNTPLAQPSLGGDQTQMHIMRPFGTQMFANDIGAATIPITYHGGRVVQGQSVVAIYWAKGKIYTNGPTAGSSGTGTADGSLVGYFLGHLGGSNYYNINTTYFDQVGGGHTVTNTLGYTSFWADNTAVPPTNGTKVTNATIRNEIIKGFNQGKIVYDPNTIYAVFTAGKTNLGGGFGSQYCAYHGRFLWNGKVILYAAMPFNNAFPAGCTSGMASPNGDIGADREVNTLGHEIEEATTDPDLNAWFDAQGEENADKCAWTWGTIYTTANGGKANMLIGSKDFLVQQNWVADPVQACAVTFP